MFVQKQINRVLIAISSASGRKSERNTNHKNILIVFHQVFGDSIILQYSLAAYTRLFPQEQGYSIKFLVRPSVLAFMKSVLPLPNDIEFEEVDFKRFLEDYRYYRQIVKKYRRTAGTLIVPGTSLSAEIFSCASDAARKIGLVRCIDVSRPWVMAYFSRRAYTEQVKPYREEMMLQRHRRLINYLGDSDYRAELPRLLPKEPVLRESYAVLCPGSSRHEKCWPIERFAKVADYIIERYGLSVHLCGGAEERQLAEQLHLLSSHAGEIVSHIGETTFSDWSAIVQHAQLVVGNDSATVHLAAAARVRTVCIAGVYDKFQFFPYRVDRLAEGERLPVTVLKDMPCAWCRTMGYDAGAGNAACKRRIKDNQCALCVDAIEVDDVLVEIDKLMKELAC